MQTLLKINNILHKVDGEYHTFFLQLDFNVLLSDSTVVKLLHSDRCGVFVLCDHF